jgi:pimeloyl-ACP methyl ester carboxylesterase
MRRHRAWRPLDALGAPARRRARTPRPARADREKRVIDGKSELADRSQILLPDRQSAELAAAARKDNPNAISTLPLEYIDETLQFHPKWVVDKIAPRPILFITTDDDRLVPPEESQALFDKADEPKSLIVLRGFGHYEVYTEPAFSQVMAPTVAWFERFMPARSDDGGTALSA